MTWHGEFDYDGGLGGSKWEIPVESSGSLGYGGGLRFDDWEMSDNTSVEKDNVLCGRDEYSFR